MTVFVFNQAAVDAHKAMLLDAMRDTAFGTPESIEATASALGFAKIIRKLTIV